MHTSHTTYVGTLTDAGAKRLGVKPGRYAYRTHNPACADVYDGAKCVGRDVDIGANGLLPDNPPTPLDPE